MTLACPARTSPPARVTLACLAGDGQWPEQPGGGRDGGRGWRLRRVRGGSRAVALVGPPPLFGLAIVDGGLDNLEEDMENTEDRLLLASQVVFANSRIAL